MRLELLSAACCVGCSGSIGALPDLRDAAVDANAADALLDGPGDDAQDADLLPPLTWTAVSANIVEGDIVSVWGTSSTDVYVGTDMQSVYHLLSGASTWTGVPAQVVGGGWGIDPQTVYAVGASAWLTQMGSASNGGLFQRTGARAWMSVATGTLYSVWGSSPNDVYAVGDQGVLHSVGGGAFANESSAGSGVLSVWGTGPTDVYVGSSMAPGTVQHSAGDGNWQSVYSDGAGGAWAIWSSGPGDVYAIIAPSGSKNPPTHLVHSTPAHGWAGEAVSQTATTLVALWGSGANDVYAGGWHEDSSGKSGDLFHSSGDGHWSRVPLPGTPYDVRCVWGSSAADVYVGIYDTQDGPVLLHGQP